MNDDGNPYAPDAPEAVPRQHSQMVRMCGSAGRDGAPHIMHAVPAYRGRLHALVAQGMARDAHWCARSGWSYTSAYINLGQLDVARNNMVRAARDAGCDLLLMQDEDVFGADDVGVLERLVGTMQRTQAAVVGAVCRARDGKHVNCCVGASRQTGLPPDGAVTFEGRVGTGAMLVNLRDLAAKPMPWFRFINSPDGLALAVGEDFGFCDDVRAAGHRVIVDAGIRTVHAEELSLVFEPRREQPAEQLSRQERRRLEREGARGVM